MLRVFFIAIITFFVISTVCGAEKPNVVIVLTDDQGYGDFSCVGNPVLKTPNLDRLHDESIRFTDFHVAPMCTPTRGQLLTGQDALHNKACFVSAGRTFMRHDSVTMPELFAKAGYRTGMFGKWHLGDNYPNRPMDRGFQEADYHQSWGFTSIPEYTNTLFNGRYFHNGTEKHFKGHCTDLWFSKAMEWMKACKEKNEPFFCYLPTNAAHVPHVVAAKYSKPYEGKGPAAFFGMIAQIDENMGKLDTFLQENGLRDNTIVIFMTDNGGTAGVPIFNAGMRGHKTEYYEGGHRVPCWIRWPAGKLGSPRDIDVAAQVQDIAPTLLELCSVSTPTESKFDGLSLSKIIQDDKSAAVFPDRMMTVQYGRVPKKWDSCVIWNKWRLVKGEELYDIKSDPRQKSDVAEKNPEVVKKMREHYEQWWSKLQPTLSDFVTTTIGSAKQPLVNLTSCDWENLYVDNGAHIVNAAGGPRGGKWALEVEREGTYEIALRRWPREINLALDAKHGPKSKSFPITAARILIGDKEESVKTKTGDKEAVFRVAIPAGTTTMQAWFQDDEDKDVCGAFYAYVRRIVEN